MASIRARFQSVKDDPFQLIDAVAVERACGEVGHCWRERTLDPVSTLRDRWLEPVPLILRSSASRSVPLPCHPLPNLRTLIHELSPSRAIHRPNQP